MVQYNRDAAHNDLDYKVALRNRRIDENGIVISVVVPIEYRYDTYGDLVYSKEIQTKTEQTSVIPQYDKYYMLRDVLGVNTENPIPLEVIVRTDFNYPRGTKLLIPLENNESSVIQEWKVLSSEIKHLDKTQTKIVTCVPWRYVAEIEDEKVEDDVNTKTADDKLAQGYEF